MRHTLQIVALALALIIIVPLLAVELWQGIVRGFRHRW